jgi:hypothetical protein
MHRKEIFFGFLAGCACVLVGIFLFDIGIGIYKGSSFSRILERSFTTVVLDKRASIGVLLNLPLFYLFLNKKKDNYAKGVLFATLLVALLFLMNML